MQSFTVRMPLMTASSAFGLRRRRWSSLQQCYLHCLRTGQIITPNIGIHTSDRERGGLRRDCCSWTDRVDGNALVDAFVWALHVSNVQISRRLDAHSSYHTHTQQYHARKLKQVDVYPGSTSTVTKLFVTVTSAGLHRYRSIDKRAKDGNRLHYLVEMARRRSYATRKHLQFTTNKKAK